MEKEVSIPKPAEIGNALIADLIFSGREGDGPDDLILLHALLKLVGIPAAEIARMTGLTRGRITQYLNYAEPVPITRQEQFYYILRGIIEAWEENLALPDAYPKDYEAMLQPDHVPVARAIVKACRKILACSRRP